MQARHLAFVAMLLLASLASPSRAADPSEGPSTFVETFGRQALLAVDGKTFSFADFQKRFEDMLDADFDVPGIATFVVGRYWQKATDTERQTFTTVYRDFMICIYSRRFADYNGQSFRVVGQVVENPTSTMVYTEITHPIWDSRSRWSGASSTGMATGSST